MSECLEFVRIRRNINVFVGGCPHAVRITDIVPNFVRINRICQNFVIFVRISGSLSDWHGFLSEWHGVLSEWQCFCRNGSVFVGMAVFLPECQAFVGMLVIMSEYLFMCQFRAAPYNIYHYMEIAHDPV